jgi:beta-glucosidase
MKKIFFAHLVSLWIPCCLLLGQESNSDRKIEDIIAKMTLEDKITFIGGYDSFYIRSDKNLGLPLIKMSDGPVGVRNYGPSTAYPASIALTASWDTAMAARVGSAIGKEARAKDVHIMLGPALNIHRAPMCGRNFEYMGEDPFLAGKMAATFIQGMQREGVMATAKHYMANYQEYDRHNVSSDMDERTLREIYLPAFEACVKEGHVAAIMTSYNLVNGVHASQHDYLINKILKSDWGFDGFVMSDWTSTYDGVAAAKGGLDLEMPYGKFMCKDTLIPAVKDGRLAEKTIDDKIRRILKAYVRFGLFENSDLTKGFVLDTSWVRNTSLEAARDGIVLLKNENNILPLNPSTIKSIAVIGPNGHPALTGGGGSSYVDPLHPISLVDALKKVMGDKVNISYNSGIYSDNLESIDFYNRTDFYTKADGKHVPGMKAEYFSKRRPDSNPEYKDFVTKVNRTLSDSIPGVTRNNFSVRYSGFLKVDKSGQYRFVVWCDAEYKLFIDDENILGSYHNSNKTFRTVFVLLKSGKEYKIELNYVQLKEKGTIRFGYETPDDYEQNLSQAITKAAALAKQNDMTILSIGFNTETEHEGADRTFKLPEEQERLIKEIMKTNKDFIVVLNAGGNVEMNAWLGNTKALVHAWYPGQEGNIAVAEILVGKTNPSGKLPVSFEKKWEDNATYKSYYDEDGDKHVKFTEGIFLGYRHFDKDNIEPNFPFGFGLSYTTFDYSNLIVNRSKFSASEPVEVKVTVKNTGNYSGAEVVELYVSDLKSSLPRPVKELKAFSKVWLNTGESKEVTLQLNDRSFQFYDPEKMKWVLEPGEFNILVGSSSRDIRLTKTITAIEKP